jgi:cytochrome c oxidase cbb3-type subunit 3
MSRRIAVALGLLALTACQRDTRELRPAPTRAALFGDAARQSEIQPGSMKTEPLVSSPDAGNAYSISEGQRLYNWYNCVGCHAHGGGGIGPPLIKKDWIYGGQPANLFDTIVKGRPNGMPAWGGKIPEYQVWQLVAYVRSLANEQPTTATAPRGDNIEPNPATLRERRQGVTR